MCNFNDISVVIHGPISSLSNRKMEDGITKKAINSIRENMPGSKIIISTWQDQNIDGLDFDKIILNNDPGQNIVGYLQDGTACKENYNRQIYSVKEGLKAVDTKYAIKLRSDNYILHTGFIGLQKAYPKRTKDLKILNERVVLLHRFTKIRDSGFNIVRHLCDFFAYGLTSDILKIWDIPLQDDFLFNPNKLGEKQHQSYPKKLISAEQLFCTQWLVKENPSSKRISYFFENSDDLQNEWETLLANNFVICEANNVGVATTPRLKGDKYRANEISTTEWQTLYKKYCDNNLYIPKYSLLFEKELYRFIKSPFERLKYLVKKDKKNVL